MQSIYSIPPEWAPHEATWLQWPKGEERFLAPAFCEIVRALKGRETVRLIVSDARVQRQAEAALISAGVGTDSVEFYPIPTDWCWCRDTGPMFALELGRLVALDWPFNGWGDPDCPHAKDDAVPQRVARALGVDRIRLSLVAEGGAMELNGAGAMIASEPCFHHRNPSTSRAEMDGYLKGKLQVEKILWLRSFPQDDMTRGHPDGIARFINESTIAVGEMLDKADADYPVFEDAASVASAAGFSVVRVPIPGRWEGMAANYMNWYVANDVVLVGTFEREEFDKQGISSVAARFPERKAIGIDVRLLWRRGGGVHCVTQQQPSIRKNLS